MNGNNELNNLREEINEVDEKIKELFEKRMNLVLDVARYKEKHNIPVRNTAREREIVLKMTEGQDDEMAGYTKTLYTALFDVSRSYQSRNLYKKSDLVGEIKKAIGGTAELFPKSAVVACQGVEGANSQIACDRLFSRPNIMYMSTFDAVFNSVERGLCKYGILPIENSLHGSVAEVYDLMRKYKFFIAKSVKIRISHTLLAKDGVRLEDIREIYSHEQALAQCGEFLKGLKNVKIVPFKNTAAAAEMVSKSDRNDIAAIASKNCGELYNLSVISEEVQSGDNNYTRFICISKALEIYPGASKVSLMFTLPHRPGALYGMISKFSALGINLTKLESRPIPGRDFEFMFHIDLEADINDPAVLNLLAQLESASEKFVFLGGYSEK